MSGISPSASALLLADDAQLLEERLAKRRARRSTKEAPKTPRKAPAPAPLYVDDDDAAAASAETDALRANLAPLHPLFPRGAPAAVTIRVPPTTPHVSPAGQASDGTGSALPPLSLKSDGFRTAAVPQALRPRRMQHCCRLRRGTVCFRFTLLGLSIWMLFAGYFTFDLPSITADSLKTQLGITNAQLGLLFSIYAVPNAVVPMLSRAFFSRVGKWKGVVIIASVITVGVAIVLVGMFLNSYDILLLGRAVYGLGSESLYVGIEILVTRWFKGAEMGLAYGAVQAMGQAGSFGAFYAAPPLLARFGKLQYVYAASLAITITSLLALALARFLEITAYVSILGSRKLNDTPGARAAGDAGDMHHSTGVMYSGSGAMAAALLDDKARQRAPVHVHEQDTISAYNAPGHVATAMVGSPIRNALRAPPVPQTTTMSLNERSPLMKRPSAGSVKSFVTDDEPYNDFDDETDELEAELADLSPCKCMPPVHALWMLLGLSHLRRMRWEFWCVVTGIICYSSAFYTFLAFGNVWLMSRYDLTDSGSGQIVGLVSIMSMVLSPTIGLITDKRGGHRYVAFVAMLGAGGAFACMGFLNLPPVAVVSWAGVCYAALPAALYPLLADVVPDESFTVCYSIVNSIVNVMLAAAYYFAGAITTGVSTSGSDTATRRAYLTANPTQPEPDFRPVFIMFCSFMALGAVVTGLLAREQVLGRVEYRQLSSHH